MVRETSIEAYRVVVEEGRVSLKRREIYEVLYHQGPLTGNEVFHALAKRKVMNQANITTRLGELRDMDLVRECGKKTDPFTGMYVLLWDVTPNLPRALQKRKSKLQQRIDAAVVVERAACAHVAEAWSPAAASAIRNRDRL